MSNEDKTPASHPTRSTARRRMQLDLQRRELTPVEDRRILERQLAHRDRLALRVSVTANQRDAAVEWFERWLR